MEFGDGDAVEIGNFGDMRIPRAVYLFSVGQMQSQVIAHQSDKLPPELPGQMQLRSTAI